MQQEFSSPSSGCMVQVQGSGIGLATCKRVVERLGGRIWADSIEGHGSAFHFTLPN